MTDILSEGYGIIPNKILFNKELSDKQKLLYCHISSLCAEKGFCWASNAFIGEKLGASPGTISKNISELAKQGYIEVGLDIKRGNIRHISLGGIVKNDQGYSQKGPEGYSQKGLHNNTSIILQSNKIENTKEISPLSEKLIEFLEYRQAKKKPILPQSKNAFLKTLEKLSLGDEKIAIEILDQSIANGWQGIFEIKSSGGSAGSKISPITF